MSLNKTSVAAVQGIVALLTVLLGVGFVYQLRLERDTASGQSSSTCGLFVVVICLVFSSLLVLVQCTHRASVLMSSFQSASGDTAMRNLVLFDCMCFCTARGWSAASFCWR